MSPQIQAFFDTVTATVTYVVHEPAPGGACAIIDSVLDYDPKSGRSSTASADRVADYVRQHGLKTEWLLETHAHADHLSAAPYLQRQLGGVIAIGQSIQTVQGVFKKIFNLEPEFQLDGSQFGHLFKDGETFRIGALTAQAIHVPGHTPADMAYLIGDAAFVGDTLFMPDGGSARADFPGGDARTLYRSIKRVLDLPPETRLFMCHDYGPNGREIRWETTVAEQRRDNIHVRDGITEDEFVRTREARDATLAMPKLIIPSLQVNMRAGALPPPDDSGKVFLKVPVNAL